MPAARGFLLAGGAALVAQRLTSRPTQDLDFFALDSPPEHAATASLVGPTFALQELAGRKVVALFDRAEARDFAEGFELSQHFSKDDLLEQAAQGDRGFDRPIFAQMLRSLDLHRRGRVCTRGTDPSSENFFATWADDLER